MLLFYFILSTLTQVVAFDGNFHEWKSIIGYLDARFKMIIGSETLQFTVLFFRNLAQKHDKVWKIDV